MEQHIMIVDDNAQLRELLGMYLTDAGYDITEAGDAESALAGMRARAIDLMVLDVVLPGRSGLFVLEEIRRSSRMPVLLISSLAESEIAWKTLGADGFLRKPLRPKELVSRVTRLLPPMTS